jgi:uncharacterized protein (UPF0335 family)
MHINQPEFKAFVDRLSNLADDADDIKMDARQVLAEAKAAGFNTRILRRVVRDMRKDPYKLREENETYDTYAHAAGLMME